MRPFKYFFALLSSLLVLGLQAQNTYSFVFHKDGKAVLVVPSNQVDSITFSANDIEPDPEPVSPQPQVYDECPDSNHPHLIDLGLPSGVKWACCNVDATNPGDFGGYYAWGETEAKENYNPGTYTVDGPNLGNSVKATNYDVAYVKWGAAWCMPSLADCQELVDNCTWTWEQYDNGNYGIRVKGKNGNSIFLPAGGFPNWGGWNRVGSYGTYWTSTHASGSQSYYFRFDSSYFETTSWDGEQYVGQSVRPVSYSNTTPVPNPDPRPDILKRDTFTVNGVSFVMVLVEGGTFQMGATSEQSSDAESDEKPVHNVTLSSYAIGQTEVTQDLWQAVMGSNPSNWKGDNLPVETVSWNDCQNFITKLNQLTGMKFRLPTEAEWEFAARGGKLSKGYKYSGSNTADDVAWYADNSGSKTHPVATKQPNELGLYDMSGNVWEWCQDWYNSSYYSSSPSNNPTGPSSDSYRVYRGGSWNYLARLCRVSFRNFNTPSSSIYYLGFRLTL